MSALDGVLSAALAAQAGAGASAAFVLVLAARPWRGRDAPTAVFGPPLAVATGTAVGYVLTRGAPGFPPAQALHWAFYLGLAAGGLGLLAAHAPRIARVAGLGLALLQPWFLLAFQRTRHWERTEGLMWSVGLALALFASWRALAWRAPSRAAPRDLGLALALALAAGAYGLGGGALFAQLAGALALSAGLCAGLGLWRRTGGVGTSAGAPLAFTHGGFAWLAHWLYELSTPSFVLLLLVPFAPLTAGLVPASRPRTRAVLEFFAPVLAAGAALGLELAAADPSAYG